MTIIVIAAATQNGCIRTQLLSATVEYQTDALFQRSLRPAKKGRPELAPQRGGESAAPRESPHSSIIANGRSDSSGSPNRQRRKFHRPRRATAAAAATALPGVIATDGVIATNGVIAALGVIRATNTNGAIRAALASYAPPTAPYASPSASYAPPTATARGGLLMGLTLCAPHRHANRLRLAATSRHETAS